MQARYHIFTYPGLPGQSKCLHAWYLCLHSETHVLFIWLSAALCKERSSNLCPGGPWAAESARQTSSPAPAEETAGLRGVTSFTGYVCSVPSHLPFQHIWWAPMLCTLGHLVGGYSTSAGSIGWESPRNQAHVPILSRLGHKRMMPLASRSLETSEEIKLRNK